MLEPGGDNWGAPAENRGPAGENYYVNSFLSSKNGHWPIKRFPMYIQVFSQFIRFVPASLRRPCLCPCPCLRPRLRQTDLALNACMNIMHMLYVY